MSNADVALLIQGPFAGSNYGKIFKKFNKLPQKVRNKISVVIVCYTSDYLKTLTALEQSGLDKEKCKLICVKDLINPGYFNINRQLKAMRCGLNAISGNPCVIKLRNDQCVDFRKVLKILKKVSYFQSVQRESRKILTTNCYTRSDRKYHPSDMFLCGRKSELIDYYDMPLMDETHMDVILRLIEHYQMTEDDMFDFFISPENLLFQNYLEHKGWRMQVTKEDSFNAIKHYCCVVNSWDIRLTWEKKRTPLLPKGTVILPYSVVNTPPFQGLPPEKVQCYSRHDFEGGITIKDRYYLFLSKLCFQYGYGTSVFSKYFLRKIAVRMARIAPRSVRRVLKSTVIYKFYSSLNSPL